MLPPHQKTRRKKVGKSKPARSPKSKSEAKVDVKSKTDKEPSRTAMRVLGREQHVSPVAAARARRGIQC